MDSNETRIREIEKNVLDKHHEAQPLLKHVIEVAVYNMLLAYGHTIRVLAGDKFSSIDYDSKRLHVSLFLKGLEWSLRSISRHCPRSDTEGIDWLYLDQEAVDLLGWGRQFAELVNAHTAWSRGEMRAAIDESLKHIRFDLDAGFDPTSVIFQWESDGFVSDDFEKSIPSGIFDDVYRRWCRYVTPEDLALSPTVADFLTGAQKGDLLDWASSLLWPELSAKTDLDGFTLGQFRQFYASLFAECECMYRIEEDSLKEASTGDVEPALLKATPTDLASFIANISRLEFKTVFAIIEMLTFDPERLDHSLSTHPFV
jgi:hypothetical protein